MALPVLDLSLSDDELSATFHEACTQYGFFYIINAISAEEQEAALRATKEFFKLSMEDKNEISASKSKNFSGYTGFNEEWLDKKNQKIGDTKEGFYIGPKGPEDSEIPLVGPNQWPKEEQLPGWRELMENYKEKCYNTCIRLLKIMGKAILLCSDEKLPENTEPFDFLPFFSSPMTFLRLLHYDGTVSDPNAGVFGCGAHTDYGVFTILTTDEVPALEIFPRASGDKSSVVDINNPAWMQVPPMKGALVVNLGDLLEIWSNNRYKSTLHRVIQRENRERYSIPYFFEPNFDSKIECLPFCCSPARPAIYPPLISGQHLLNMYKGSHDSFDENNIKK